MDEIDLSSAGEPNLEESQTEPTTDTSGGEPAPEAQTIVDLDSLEKFKFAGREWTPKDFQGAYMMQSDYTKKTSEIAQERKYYENLQFDLESVKADPSLAAKFKAIYPDKFHAYLRYVSETPRAAPGEATGNAKVQAGQPDPALLERLERIESDFRERKIDAINAELDAKFKTYSGKYPMADEDSVVARAQTLLEGKRRTSPLNEQSKVTITEKEWDDLWKSSHERVQKLADQHYSTQVNAQKTANIKGKDAASGGGIGGQAVKQPRTVKGMTDQLFESGAVQNL